MVERHRCLGSGGGSGSGSGARRRIAERLSIIAPHWGRLRPGRVAKGPTLSLGTTCPSVYDRETFSISSVTGKVCAEDRWNKPHGSACWPRFGATSTPRHPDGSPCWTTGGTNARAPLLSPCWPRLTTGGINRTGPAVGHDSAPHRPLAIPTGAPFGHDSAPHRPLAIPTVYQIRGQIAHRARTWGCDRYPFGSRSG